jgi:hypothetical protein
MRGTIRTIDGKPSKINQIPVKYFPPKKAAPVKKY